MRHDVCPATMTPENLADWIRTNKIEVFNHTEKHPLNEEEIAAFERQSSMATRQIAKLDSLVDYFQGLIKNGTPFDTGLNDHKPVSVTIPPTKGKKVMEANRDYATDQLEKGVREDITPIYMMPWAEFDRIVAIDIEGKEWSKYSRPMTDDEKRQHGKPILRASVSIQEALDKSGIEIESVSGKEVKLTKKKRNKPEPEGLLGDGEESDELNL